VEERRLTVYFDSQFDERQRRQRLYSGDIFVFSPRPSSIALTDLAREFVEDAFRPLDPLRAQFDLPVERFIEIVSPSSRASFTTRARRRCSGTC
jgi:hypothetical protein